MDRTTFEERVSRATSAVDKLSEELETIAEELHEACTRDLLDELRPVFELAWRHDPSLVDYHLRRLGVDPGQELAAVQAEAVREGRAA